MYWMVRDAWYVAVAGFATVLKRIADVWRSRRNEIVEQSADTMRQLSEAIQPQGQQSPDVPSAPDHFSSTIQHLASSLLIFPLR